MVLSVWQCLSRERTRRAFSFCYMDIAALCPRELYILCPFGTQQSANCYAVELTQAVFGDFLVDTVCERAEGEVWRL